MQPVDYSGARGPIELFDRKRMGSLLEQPNVKEVAVFKLRSGMIISIDGHDYRVNSVNAKGKAVIKPVK